MDYKILERRGNDIVLTGIKHFDPEHTFDCGQCFRWSGGGGIYSGVAHGRLLELFVCGEELTLKNMGLDEFESVWKNYFDFERDYGGLGARFTRNGALGEALKIYPGLRVLRQEPWETLITFILSQNNNIPRIKGIVARLCENFGDELSGGGFSFPGAETLARLSEEGLSPVRCGYRAAYILDAARRVADGRLDLKSSSRLSSEELCEELRKIRGVGLKVAECILLYGFGRAERFPLDVWMKRVMASYYPSGFPEEWADAAGIAQQFLFHYIRNKRE